MQLALHQVHVVLAGAGEARRGPPDAARSMVRPSVSWQLAVHARPLGIGSSNPSISRHPGSAHGRVEAVFDGLAGSDERRRQFPTVADLRIDGPLLHLLRRQRPGAGRRPPPPTWTSQASTSAACPARTDLDPQTPERAMTLSPSASRRLAGSLAVACRRARHGRVSTRATSAEELRHSGPLLSPRQTPSTSSPQPLRRPVDVGGHRGGVPAPPLAIVDADSLPWELGTRPRRPAGAHPPAARQRAACGASAHLRAASPTTPRPRRVDAAGQLGRHRHRLRAPHVVGRRRPGTRHRLQPLAPAGSAPTDRGAGSHQGRTHRSRPNGVTRTAISPGHRPTARSITSATTAPRRTVVVEALGCSTVTPTSRCARRSRPPGARRTAASTNKSMGTYTWGVNTMLHRATATSTTTATGSTPTSVRQPTVEHDHSS